MNTVKEHLHTAIEQLSEEKADTVLPLVEVVHRRKFPDDSPRSRENSTLKIPNDASRKFRDIEAVTALGKPASQQLIEDRR